MRYKAIADSGSNNINTSGGAQVTDYTFQTVQFSDTDFVIYDLSPNTFYEVGVQAVDQSGFDSAFASISSVQTPRDASAPNKPAGFSTIASNPLRVQFIHKLGQAKDNNGNNVSPVVDFTLAKDIDHLNIYASTTSGFNLNYNATTKKVVNSNFKIGELKASHSHITNGIATVGYIDLDNATTHFFRLTAVDSSGNESEPSDEQSGNAELVNTAHISNLAVTEALIANAAITNAKIATAAIGTANIQDAAITNAKIDSLNADKITAGTIAANRLDLSGVLSVGGAANDINGNSTQIDGGKIVANTVTVNNANISGTLDFAKITASSVEIIEGMMASNSVNSSAIKDGNVTTSELVTSSSRGTFGTSGNDIFCSFIGANSATLSNRLSTDSSGVTITGTVSILPSSSSTIGNGNTFFSGSSYSGGSYGNGSSGINISSGSDIQFVRASSEKFKITSIENRTFDDIRPSSDNAFDLGQSNRRFDDVFATNGTINTSDITLKDNVVTTDLGLDFLNDLTPIEFTWKDGGVRTHLGFSAQDIKEKLITYKGTDQNMAVYTQGSYETYYEKVNEDEYGGFDLVEVEEHDFERFGLRHNELIPVLTKAIQELSTKVDDLTARLEVLEG